MDRLQIINKTAAKCEEIAQECKAKGLSTYYSISLSANGDLWLYISIEDKDGSTLHNRNIHIGPDYVIDNIHDFDEIRTVIKNEESIRQEKIARLREQLEKLEKE